MRLVNIVPSTVLLSTLASAQTMVAAGRSPGNCNGRVAAALATMPVPMIDANQFGVRFDTICPRCSSWRNRPCVRGGATVGVIAAGMPRSSYVRPAADTGGCLWCHNRSL